MTVTLAAGAADDAHSHHLHAGHAHPVADSGPMVAGVPYTIPEPNGFTRFMIRMYERSPVWLAPAAVLLCFFGAASYVLISNPSDGGAFDSPTCIVKMTTGLDCPGCGGTRAFYYLLRGNLPEAVRHHAMAVFAAPFLVWLFAAWSIKTIWGKDIPIPQISSRTISVFLAAWGVFMVVRNIPIAPFTSLYV
jgi:Protein of unknown function (DUF2752)